MVEIVFPQGGPKSPLLFREYCNDIPACMLIGNEVWVKGEEEDSKELRTKLH